MNDDVESGFGMDVFTNLRMYELVLATFVST